MSKIEVKKYVNSLDKNTLVKLIMDLYSAHKEVKDILEYTIRPDDNAKLEECKASSRLIKMERGQELYNLLQPCDKQKNASSHNHALDKIPV